MIVQISYNGRSIARVEDAADGITMTPENKDLRETIESYRASGMSDRQLLESLPYRLHSRVMAVIVSDRADAEVPDLPEMIADRGLELSDNATQGWLSQVKQWLAQQSANGADLQVMRDRLPEVYEQMDSEPFADALLQISLLANLTGREEVDQEKNSSFL